MLRDQVIDILRTIFDPEIPVNIYELGLIYDVHADDAGTVNVRMTLTSPNCPVADSLPRQVKSKIESSEGVSSANVELVWEPPWSVERMSDRAKAELELMGLDLSRMGGHGPRVTNVTIGRTAPRRKD